MKETNKESYLPSIHYLFKINQVPWIYQYNLTNEQMGSEMDGWMARWKRPTITRRIYKGKQCTQAIARKFMLTNCNSSLNAAGLFSTASHNQGVLKGELATTEFINTDYHSYYSGRWARITKLLSQK